MYSTFFNGHVTELSAKIVLSYIFIPVPPLFSISGALFSSLRSPSSPVSFPKDFSFISKYSRPFSQGYGSSEGSLAALFQQVPLISCTSTELNPAMEEGATDPGDNAQHRAYDLHELGNLKKKSANSRLSTTPVKISGLQEGFSLQVSQRLF